MSTKRYQGAWMWAAAGIAAGAMLSGSLTYYQSFARPVEAADAKAIAASNPSTVMRKTVLQTAWIPKINVARPPETAPTGMSLIPGGQFWMGAEDGHMSDTKPWHPVYVDGFWMDTTEVTNQQFTEFVKTTGYLTVAERKPRAQDYPQALKERLVTGSVVFSPPDRPVALDNQLRWWSYVPNANWRHPESPNADIKDRMNHPVVDIAYEDAVSYCNWADKRLPTEAEFEFASRGGLDRKRYVWGDEFMPGGKPMANTFQGHFPDSNSGKDGYTGTAPVGSFPANGYGLVDMAGNVWEWTSDWYRPDYYQTLAATGEVAVNPQGPSDSFDPNEPGTQKRVQRGGSFLCTDQYCARYIAGGRGKGEMDTGTNHLGFRCVRDFRATPVRPQQRVRPERERLARRLTDHAGE